MVSVAVRSIRGQMLRTSLTVGIIGIGIMALIAMVTATESLKANVRPVSYTHLTLPTICSV